MAERSILHLLLSLVALTQFGAEYSCSAFTLTHSHSAYIFGVYMSRFGAPHIFSLITFFDLGKE